MLADLKVLMDTVNTLGGWLQQALRHAKRERDRKAAQLLHDAIVPVASMRTYDNAFRQILGQLLTFSNAWEPDRRHRTSDSLLAFLDREEILPYFRQAYGSLAHAPWEGKGAESLDKLLERAERFGHLTQAIYMSKEDYLRRQEVVYSLRYAQREEESQIVRDWASTTLTLLDRRLLAEADDALAALRRDVLAAYALPDSGFAVHLSLGGSQS